MRLRLDARWVVLLVAAVCPFLLLQVEQKFDQKPFWREEPPNDVDVSLFIKSLQTEIEQLRSELRDAQAGGDGRLLSEDSANLNSNRHEAASTGRRSIANRSGSKVMDDSTDGSVQSNHTRRGTSPTSQQHGSIDNNSEASDAVAAHGKPPEGDKEDIHDIDSEHSKSDRKSSTGGNRMHMPSEVEALSYSVSVLLFLFLCVNMMLLYLTNYRDANVRSYVYKMISSTLSILCAVLINRATFSCIFDQIITGKPPYGLGLPRPPPLADFAIGLVLLCIAFFGINVLLYHLQLDRNFMFAVRSMGGHITAFAGIFTFGSLQQARFARQSLKWNVTITASASLVFLIMRLSSRKLRHHLKTHGLRGQYSRVAVEEAMEDSVNNLPRFRQIRGFDDVAVWVEEACEAEDEATSLCSSFLIFQGICFANIGKLLPMEGDLTEYTTEQRRTLTFWSFVLLVVVVVVTFLRAKYGDMLPSDPTSLRRRYALIAQNFLALTMCWSLFRVGDWYWRSRIHNGSMAKVVNAVVVTVVAVVVIIIMDMFADSLVEQAHTQVHQDMIVRSKTIVEKQEVDIQMGARLSLYHIVDPAAFQELCKKLNVLPDNTHTERALRTLIGATGFLVGICWDRCFETSDENIVESSKIIGQHPVLAKVVIAFVLVIVVFPAWMTYLVPYAQLTEAEHWWLLQHEKKGLLGFRRNDRDSTTTLSEA